jgi:hypothetical protein
MSYITQHNDPISFKRQKNESRIKMMFLYEVTCGLVDTACVLEEHAALVLELLPGSCKRQWEIFLLMNFPTINKSRRLLLNELPCVQHTIALDTLYCNQNYYINLGTV